jgi:hypothetical protein
MATNFCATVRLVNAGRVVPENPFHAIAPPGYDFSLPKE